MKFLKREKQTINKYSPSLIPALSKHELMSLEGTNSPAIDIFKNHGALGLLLPTEYGGMNANAVDALMYQVGLASIAPSLSIATTMHQYKIATLVEMAKNRDISALLNKVGRQNLLIASGGSEGKTGGNLFYPTMTASDTKDGLLINGTKRPCCLTWSMDLLSVLLVTDKESKYAGELVNVIIDASDSSIQRNKFWKNRFLMATESDEITLKNTIVKDENIFRVGTPKDSKPFATSAFLWFELLITGAYLGIASRLIEILIDEKKASNASIAPLDIQFSTQMAALEFVAQCIDKDQGTNEDLLALVLKVRYSTQDTITNIASTATELLGGLTFVTSEETSLLAISCRGLMFHPPSRHNMHEKLINYMETNDMILA